MVRIMPKFILYACPVGPLADQVQAFLDQSRAQFGPNAAHGYMPHCTLTGFFSDDPAVVPGDLQRLDRLLARALPTGPRPAVRVTGWGAKRVWLGLDLDAPWLSGLAQDFAASTKAGPRQTPVKAKSGLHLTLANAFPGRQHAPLVALARQMVDPKRVASARSMLCSAKRAITSPMAVRSRISMGRKRMAPRSIHCSRARLPGGSRKKQVSTTVGQTLTNAR